MSAASLEAAALAYALAQGYAPPAPPPSGASPYPMPTTPPSGWAWLWREDFNTDVALGAWPAGSGTPTSPPGYTDLTAYPHPWPDPPGPSHYDPSRVLSIHGGALDLYLHTDPTEGPLSGTVTPKLGGGQTRLWVQTCALFPAIPGFHASFLLWPDDNVWPGDGEIDWPEGDLSGTATAECFMHEEGATSGGQQLSWNSGLVLADGKWHVYTLEWVAAGHVAVSRDGTSVHTFTESQAPVPSKAMHYEIQTGVPSSAPASSAGHVLIDWCVIGH